MTKIHDAGLLVQDGESKREDLGTQTTEGLVAHGTRTTTTIPVGTIGNEQPLMIVSKQWFLPKLQVLVLTRHSHPRFGGTVYRVSGIVRAEPHCTLFEGPADYTVKNFGERKHIRRDRPIRSIPARGDPLCDERRNDRLNSICALLNTRDP
jgi:hypothetical protein